MATRLLDHLYAGDIGGNVYSWESGRDNWDTALKIFQAPAGDAGITYRMDVGMLGGQPWLFYQTGDIENLNFSTSGYRLYALNASRASEQSPLTIADLEGLTPTQGTASNTNGWYLDFRATPAEIPSTPVTFYNGYLLFATFSGNFNDPCAIGSSRFYAVNALTGGGAWGGGNKFIQLEGLQVAGITVFDDKVYLGVVGSASAGDLKSALGDSARLTGTCSPSIFPRRYLPAGMPVPGPNRGPFSGGSGGQNDEISRLCRGEGPAGHDRPGPFAFPVGGRGPSPGAGCGSPANRGRRGDLREQSGCCPGKPHGAALRDRHREDGEVPLGS